MYKFEEIKDYAGGFKDRSHWERQAESKWAHSAIGNIENFLGTVDWDKLASTDVDLYGYAPKSDIELLKEWNQHRMDADTSLQQQLTGQPGSTDGGLFGRLDKLESWKTNLDTTTEIEDITGLDQTLSDLKKKYEGDASEVGSFANLLGTSGFMKESNFDTRMSANLEALGLTLGDDGITNIGGLDIGKVLEDIKGLKDDETLSNLASDFDGFKEADFGDTLIGTGEGSISELANSLIATGTKVISDYLDTLMGTGEGSIDQLIATGTKGISDDVSNLQTDYKTLTGQGEGSIAQQIQSGGDALKTLIETGRGTDLANLELKLGKDRASDLLTTKTDIAADRLSDIQGIAAVLRQERGDDIFDLSETFDKDLGALQKELGGDITDLFGTTAGLTTGVEALTSGLGTTSQQLDALQTSFGDYKETAATNLGNVKAAFEKDIGKQGTEFTKQLSDLESSTAKDILGLKEDVTSDRAKALSDLDTTWSGKLQAQDDRLQTQFDKGTEALNKRLSDISASMNYRTLDDSAQGVKIRRSKAFNTGRTRSGTGQLGRSMKISTLNI